MKKKVAHILLETVLLCMVTACNEYADVTPISTTTPQYSTPANPLYTDGGFDLELDVITMPHDAVLGMGRNSIIMDDSFSGKQVGLILYGNTQAINGELYHVEDPVLQWHGKNLALDAFAGWGGLYQAIVSCDTALLEPGQEYAISFSAQSGQTFSYYSKGFFDDFEYKLFDPLADRSGILSTIRDGTTLDELIVGDRRALLFSASENVDLRIVDIQIASAGTNDPFAYEPFRGGSIVLDGVSLRSVEDICDELFLDTDGYWKILRRIELVGDARDTLRVASPPRKETLIDRHQYALNAITGEAGLYFGVYAGGRIDCEYAIYPLSDEQTRLAKKAEAREHGGFLTAKGSELVDEDGKPFVIRGINTSEHWTPSFNIPGHAQSIYRQFARFGFNTVRICFGADVFETRLSDGSYAINENSLDMLEKSVWNARLAGIRIIVDMHIPQGGWHGTGSVPYLFSSEGHAPQKRYIDMWTAIAQRLAGNDNVIGYGLCNEPQVVSEGDHLQAIREYEHVMQELIESIRSVDQRHVLIFMEPTVGQLHPDGYIEEVHLTDAPVQLIYLRDPRDNMMLETHEYLKANGPYNNDAIVSNINWDNIASSGDEWLNLWQTSSLYDASDAGSWKELDVTLSATALGKSYNTFNLMLDSSQLNTPMYIERIIIARNRDGTEETILDVSADDTDITAIYDNLLPGAKVTNHPQESSRKCWLINDVNGNWNGYYILKNIALIKGDEFRIHMRVYVRDSMSASEYACIKANVQYFVPLTASEPLFEYNDQNAVDLYWRTQIEKAAAYGVPLYLGEWNVFTQHLNEYTKYELWVMHMTDAMHAAKANASVHFAFGESLGLWSDDYGRPDYLNVERARLLKQYFVNNPVN